MSKNSVVVAILAAGLGRRMGGAKPKVLINLNSQPLIKYLLKSVDEANICRRPIIVIGAHGEQVKTACGPVYQYVWQREPLGTGHAVGRALEHLTEPADQLMVFYGDSPMISTDTIKQLINARHQQNNVLTFATTALSDFNGWRANFFNYGRVVRDGANQVIKIVEQRDASVEELLIKEVNSGYYCFNIDWLRDNLKKLNADNQQQEYYLTDLVGLAVADGRSIGTILIKDPVECLGVNTPAQLKILEATVTKRERDI